MTSVALLARTCSLGMLFGEWGRLVSRPRCRKDKKHKFKDGKKKKKKKTLNKKGEVRYTCLEFTAVSAQSLSIYRRKQDQLRWRQRLTTTRTYDERTTRIASVTIKGCQYFKFIHSKQRISLRFFKDMASQYDLIMDLRLLLLWLRCKIDRSIAIFSC